MLKIRKSFINTALILGVLSIPGFAFLGTDALFAAQDDAWLGVVLQELDDPLREAMNLQPRQTGVVVAEVVSGSPAQEAGIKDGDLLVAIDSKSLDSVEEAINRVQGMNAGTKVSVTVLREGQTKNLRVTLGTREDNPEVFMYETPRTPRAPEPPVPPEMDEGDTWTEDDDQDAPIVRKYRHLITPETEATARGFLGVSTIDLNEQLAAYFGVTGDRGVLVTEVSPESPAEKAGLRAGDILLAVSQSNVDSPRDLQRLVRAHDPEDTVVLEVMRKGAPLTLNATLGASKDFGSMLPGRHRAYMRAWRDSGRHFKHLGRQLHLLQNQGFGPGRMPHRIHLVEPGPAAEI